MSYCCDCKEHVLTGADHNCRQRRQRTTLGPSDATDCSPSSSSTEDSVVDLIRSRGKVGRGKYNHTMDRRDLRPEQWMQHLQEELGDALQYAERVKNCGKLLDDARSIMLALLHERDWECAAEWVERHDAQFFPENAIGHQHNPMKSNNEQSETSKDEGRTMPAMRRDRTPSPVLLVPYPGIEEFHCVACGDVIELPHRCDQCSI